MSKERLEEIKDRYMDFKHDFNLKKEDVEFLLKQAERVQELEKLNKRLHEALFLEQKGQHNKHWRI